MAQGAEGQKGHSSNLTTYTRKTTSRPLGWQEAKTQAVTSAGEDTERLEPLYTVGGNARWGTTVETRRGRPCTTRQIHSQIPPRQQENAGPHTNCEATQTPVRMNV